MNLLNKIIDNIKSSSESVMTDKEILETEIKEFLKSDKRQKMITGDAYYEGIQEVLNKQRLAIGENNSPVAVHNLPNARLIDNRYADLVDQKVSYLLSQPMEVRTEDKRYKEELDKILNAGFRLKLRDVGVDTLNGGIAYMYPYIEKGELKFKRFAPHSIIPIWNEEEHEELNSFLRIYEAIKYEGKKKLIITKVEHYTLEGVNFYEYREGKLINDSLKENISYVTIENKPFNWQKIPLIVFKLNSREIPLICRVKCLQDALNTLISNFTDNMQEDIRSTILIIENYDGENLAQFRHNLALYGAIKVKTEDGVKGDVRTLSVKVDANNYETVIKLLRRAIVDNGHGFDAKDERMNNNPNQMNIKSMYSSIELDANIMELQFQASLQNMLYFINTYLGIKGIAADKKVEFVFNRDLPINEADVINNCKNSAGILSRETIIKNHPWTINTDEELKRLTKEEQDQLLFNDYQGMTSHEE